MEKVALESCPITTGHLALLAEVQRQPARHAVPCFSVGENASGSHLGTAGFGPCFHLPGFHIGYVFFDPQPSLLFFSFSPADEIGNGRSPGATRQELGLDASPATCVDGGLRLPRTARATQALEARGLGANVRMAGGHFYLAHFLKIPGLPTFWVDRFSGKQKKLGLSVSNPLRK